MFCSSSVLARASTSVIGTRASSEAAQNKTFYVFFFFFLVVISGGQRPFPLLIFTAATALAVRLYFVCVRARTRGCSAALRVSSSIRFFLSDDGGTLPCREPNAIGLSGQQVCAKRSGAKNNNNNNYRASLSSTLLLPAFTLTEYPRVALLLFFFFFSCVYLHTACCCEYIIFWPPPRRRPTRL